MSANFLTGVETKLFGSSEPKKPKRKEITSDLFFSRSDPSIRTSCYYLKQAHLEACPFKIVTCTIENCHVTVKRKDLEQHVTNTCEWRIIECEYCEEPHPKRHLQVSRIKITATLFFNHPAIVFPVDNGYLFRLILT